MVMRVLDNIKCPPGLATMRHVGVSSAEGYHIHEFLSMEALFLDHRQYEEWTTLLTRDIIYQCPAELFATGNASGPPPQVTREYDYEFLVRHVRSIQGTTNDPPRLRRLIANVIIATGPSHREFSVTSYLLMPCAPDDAAVMSFATVERHDVIRRCSRSFQIARREVRFALPDARIARLAQIM